MDKVKIIHFDKRTDERGSLMPMESFKQIPFEIKRIFFLKGMGELPRGNHANKISVEILIPISGSLNVELTDGKTTEKFNLDKDNEGLLIPNNIWIKMTDFSKDCIVAVICSYKYDESEAVRNYDDYLRLIK